MSESVKVEIIENIEVLVFASNSGQHKITVPINPTKKQLETALKEQTNVNPNNLVWQDGLTQTELNSSNSILSNKGNKGMLYLTPKNNKAGMRSFRELRSLAKTETGLKYYFADNTIRFNKNNWTRLSREELDILYNEFSTGVIMKPTQVVEPVVEAPIVELPTEVEVPLEVFGEKGSLGSDFDLGAMEEELAKTPLEVYSSDNEELKKELAEIKAMISNLPKVILAITKNIDERAFNKALKRMNKK